MAEAIGEERGRIGGDIQRSLAREGREKGVFLVRGQDHSRAVGEAVEQHGTHSGERESDYKRRG